MAVFLTHSFSSVYPIKQFSILLPFSIPYLKLKWLFFFPLVFKAERKIMITKTNPEWYCLMCDSDVKEILNNFEKFEKMSIDIEKYERK